jgi:hypothetical protein
MPGKYLSYLLMDDTPNGRIECKIGNWSGIAYKIPYNKLLDCKNIEELKRSGVYFLFKNSGDEDRPLVYVGQADERQDGEGILGRLKEHYATPKEGLEGWYEAITFTNSTDSKFGGTEISWLENQFFLLATKANRYKTINGVIPHTGKPPKEIVIMLESYVENAKIVMGVLGHKLFEPLSSPTITTAKNNSTTSAVVDFELKQGDDILLHAYKSPCSLKIGVLGFALK